MGEGAANLSEPVVSSLLGWNIIHNSNNATSPKLLRPHLRQRKKLTFNILFNF